MAIIIGTSGNDTRNGTAEDDSIFGLEGNDILAGLGGADLLDGGAGTDTASYAGSASGVAVSLAAGSASGGDAEGDMLVSIENLTGSGHNDTLEGDGGDNVIAGGAGNDTVSYEHATAGVTVSLALTGAQDTVGAGSDTLSGFENLTGSAFDDTLTGNGSSNVLIGGLGNDTLNGGTGADTLIGGAGNDTYVVANAGDVVTEAADEGTDMVQSSVNYTLGADVENLTLTGTGNRTGTGNATNNIVTGNSGNNVLAGLGGADVLDGGAGTDTATYAASLAGVSISLTTGLSSGGDAEGDTLASIENLTGSGQNDALEGDDGDNVLAGGAGTDTVSYEHATAGVTVSLAVTGVQNTVGAGSDRLSGFENLTGSAFDDTLTGNSSTNTLFGGLGNDRLQGRNGDDLLDGGLGFDRAIYADGTGSITVNLAAGTVSGAGVGTDALVAVEGVVGSDAADTFDATGFTGWSEAAGTPVGFNEFEGGGGDDVIIGNVNGQGQALTRVSYVSATGAVTVDIADGTADGDASVGHDTFSHVSVAWGSGFDDTLRGSDTGLAIFEIFEGRGGDDFIDGRGGYDRVDYNNDPTTATGVTVDLAAGTVTGDGTVGTDTLRGIEAIRGSNFDDLYDATGFGSVGALNVGSSGAFNDFAGVGGNDTIIGNGATRLNFINALGGITADLETSAIGTTTAITVSGTATGISEGTDTFSGVNAVYGSTFDDTMLGSSFNNQFTGLAGDDFIDGRGGFDNVGYLNASLNTGGVNVDLAAGTATGDASIGTDTLRSIEGIGGTNFADTFDATGYGLADAANVGNNGNFNTFEGLAGDDSITGNGNTQVQFNNATAGVTVDLATGNVNGDASVGHDTITGGVNRVFGSNFGDTISGGTGNETLIGNGGDDIIGGGGGNDFLVGGSGNDNFVFASGASAGASVTDFAGNGAAAGDSLEFHGFGLAADGATLTWLTGTQWQVHSGLDGHDEIITLTGTSAASVHSTDYQFLV